MHRGATGNVGPAPGENETRVRIGVGGREDQQGGNGPSAESKARRNRIQEDGAAAHQEGRPYGD